jgi:hypothetical protein
MTCLPNQPSLVCNASQVAVLLDDGSQRVPLADAAATLAATALSYAVCKPDMQHHPRWGRVVVESPTPCQAGARQAVVIIRGRSYPSLFGGMFAAPQLTLLPPERCLFGAQTT